MRLNARDIAQVRAFNRDYTRRIGVLGEGLLDSAFSLTEGRVIYEIANQPGITAGELAERLSLDRGYLSRLLKRLLGRKLLAREQARDDARRQPLRLTAAGKRQFDTLDRRSREQVAGMLGALDRDRRHRALAAMRELQSVFDPDGAPDTGKIVLRAHRPGDIGWVIQRHGELYHREEGWGLRFETIVAEVASAFLRDFDPRYDRCWIAERGGERLGSIFLVRFKPGIAKLRLLLVEPAARGHGLGRRLIETCLAFARDAGYRKMILWTQSNLAPARHLYEQAGFRKINEAPETHFDTESLAETWELML